jgi:hypothetical protein
MGADRRPSSAHARRGRTVASTSTRARCSRRRWRRRTCTRRGVLGRSAPLARSTPPPFFTHAHALSPRLRISSLLPLAIAALRSARRLCRTCTGVAEGHGAFAPGPPPTVHPAWRCVVPHCAPTHPTTGAPSVRLHSIVQSARDPACAAPALARGISNLFLLTPHSPMHHPRALLHPPTSHCATRPGWIHSPPPSHPCTVPA